MNNNMQQQTTINIQEKANLIWAIADKLVGVYKPHEYGNVILPMCVIKRFEDTLAPTKQAVLDTNAKLDKDGIVVKKGFLETAAGQQFYNLSPFTFQSLLNDPENIKENFESYLNHFSENVIDIIHRMDFDRELQKMADNNVLYLVIKEFCTAKAYLGADVVTSVDMGYIFEELGVNSRKAMTNRQEHTLPPATLSISWQNCLSATMNRSWSVKVLLPLSMIWRWVQARCWVALPNVF